MGAPRHKGSKDTGGCGSEFLFSAKKTYTQPLHAGPVSKTQETKTVSSPALQMVRFQLKALVLRRREWREKSTGFSLFIQLALLILLLLAPFEELGPYLAPDTRRKCRVWTKLSSHVPAGESFGFVRRLLGWGNPGGGGGHYIPSM